MAKERGPKPPAWHEPAGAEIRAMQAWLDAERAKGVAESKLT
jgi:hypothetical protein